MGIKHKRNLTQQPRPRRRYLKTDAVALFIAATVCSFYLMNEPGLDIAMGFLSYTLGGIVLGFTARWDKPLIGMVIMGMAFGAAFTVNAETVTNSGVYGFAFIGILFATGFFVSEQLSHKA